MPKSIFISYRRDDSSGAALHLFEMLKMRFGERNVFMDIEGIGLGHDFVEVLDTQLSRSSVVLSVIGPGWLDARDAAGRRRLTDEHDHLRKEIATAFGRSIPVVPVLVDGAGMPPATELPPELRPLSTRQAIEISHTRFKSDVNRLCDALQRDYVTRAPVSRSVAAVLAAALLAMGCLIWARTGGRAALEEAASPCPQSATLKDSVINTDCLLKPPDEYLTYAPAVKAPVITGIPVPEAEGDVTKYATEHDGLVAPTVPAADAPALENGVEAESGLSEPTADPPVNGSGLDGAN